MALIFKKPPKRKAGQRAGLTRAKIIDAAVKLWDDAGPNGFAIRKLAKQLKVGATTIRAHVKGGIPELGGRSLGARWRTWRRLTSRTRTPMTICGGSSARRSYPFISAQDWPGSSLSK
jgi:hypothetical protein